MNLLLTFATYMKKETCFHQDRLLAFLNKKIRSKIIVKHELINTTWDMCLSSFVTTTSCSSRSGILAYLLHLQNRWFSHDVITTMLVNRTKEKKLFWEFDSIIMQNMSQICHCFVHQHGHLFTWFKTIYTLWLKFWWW